MSKPDSIPDDIWNKAVSFTGIGGGHEMQGALHQQRIDIASALMEERDKLEFMTKSRDALHLECSGAIAALVEAKKALGVFAQFADWPLNGMGDDTPVSCRVYSDKHEPGEHPIAGFGLSVAEFRAAKKALQPA